MQKGPRRHRLFTGRTRDTLGTLIRVDIPNLKHFIWFSRNSTWLDIQYTKSCLKFHKKIQSLIFDLKSHTCIPPKNSKISKKIFNKSTRNSKCSQLINQLVVNSKFYSVNQMKQKWMEKKRMHAIQKIAFRDKNWIKSKETQRDHVNL